MSKKIYVDADNMLPVVRMKIEQETTINWLRSEDKVRVCTSDLTIVTKLRNVMRRDPDNYKCYYLDCNVIDGAVGNYFFEFPKNLLSFRVSNGEREELSSEEVEDLKTRFKKEGNDVD